MLEFLVELILGVFGDIIFQGMFEVLAVNPLPMCPNRCVGL